MTGITQRLGSRLDMAHPKENGPSSGGRKAGAVWCISRGKRDPASTGIGTGGSKKRPPVLGSQPGPTTAVKAWGPKLPASVQIRTQRSLVTAKKKAPARNAGAFGKVLPGPTGKKH